MKPEDILMTLGNYCRTMLEQNTDLVQCCSYYGRVWANFTQISIQKTNEENRVDWAYVVILLIQSVSFGKIPKIRWMPKRTKKAILRQWMCPIIEWPKNIWHILLVLLSVFSQTRRLGNVQLHIRFRPRSSTILAWLSTKWGTQKTQKFKYLF